MSDVQTLERPATGAKAPSAMKAPAVTVPTRQALLRAVANALSNQPQVNFGTLNQIEYIKDEQEFRGALVAGTPLATAETVLGDAGLVIDGTVGTVMDGLRLDRDDLHALVCNCHGDIVDGATAAKRFNDLADGA